VLVGEGTGREAQLRAAWVAWLRTFRWDYFATGTWTHPVSAPTARAVVQRWLAACASRDPHVRPSRWRDPYAAVGVQRGSVGKHHVHLLIGGLGRHPATAAQLRGAWIKGGHVQVAGYAPQRGAIEYMVRQADDLELLGTPVPYRPRR
jgi:hypothetical protein